MDEVEIRNFQSLQDIRLPFGRFTVVTGPSHSGKSALMRALAGVASGIRGTGSITVGARSASISVRRGDTLVTLEHSRGAWRYRTVEDGEENEYTKTYGGVPPAVTAALRLQPVSAAGESVNFAKQGASPYLLDEPGPAVARILGRLTGVTTILEAAREGVRRSAEISKLLKVREADLAQVTARARDFAALPARLTACDAAENAAARAADLDERIGRLDRARAALAAAETVLAEQTDALPAVPDLDRLTTAQDRLDRLTAALRTWHSATDAITAATAAVDQAVAAEGDLDAELHDLLVAAGTCPTCQQSTRNL